MADIAEYRPSSWRWVREQIELYERTGGTEGNTLRDTGRPIVVVTMRGRKTGDVRKIAVMRVEREGEYAIVGSKGGQPNHPGWYYNLVESTDDVTLQDGPAPFRVNVRLVTGEERANWWQRAVETYPAYEEYQSRTSREIPVFVATRTEVP